MRGFAAWLFGLAAEQPREYRRLLRIRRQIFTPVAQLGAEIVRSAEPIPFAQLDHSDFVPLRPGTAWGKKLDCAWLRISGEIPAGIDPAMLDGVVLLLGIRGEGLIYSADGEILDSISTVWQQADLPHSGGKYRPVRHVDVSTGRIEFYADVAYNGILLYEYGSGVYHGAQIAVRDDDAFGLYYDYMTLLVLAGATDDTALESELRRQLRHAYALFRAGDILGAREVLARPLSIPSDSDFVYSAIGHGHLDMAWLWPLRETRRKAARTYTKALNTIEQHDGYTYGTSQPQQMQWLKQQQPDLFERLKKAVADGRVELQGSFWVEPDTNLPGGESLVRQALVGRRFLAEEFGLGPDDMRLCWLPDAFGYSGNLPQILKKSGMDWFQTIKLAWNKVNDFPYRTFTWRGIDGSTVLVHMPPEGDYNSRGAADGLLKGLKQYPEKDLDTALLVYGSGDGGGGPGEIHLEMIEREHNLRGLPRIEHSRADTFFRSLEKLDAPHIHVGELYLETHQGTYTTQAKTKQYNRLVERQLHNAEALAAITGDDSRPVLEQHWRDVLLNQFHDILPGSAIARVNREAIETYQRIEKSLDAYAGELTARLPHAGSGPSAINLTGLARHEHLKVEESWFVANVQPYAAAQLELVGAFPELGYSDDSLTNGLLTLRFGPSGEIVSCLDAGGVEHSAGGLNRLVLHRDPYQFPFDAWDIKQDYATATPRTLKVSTVESSIDGATVTRRQVYRSRKLTIEQKVTLESGSDVVRFDTQLAWHESHRMLRAQFFPARYGDTAWSEIQFGHIGRPTTENDVVEKAQFETVAHKWIATQDARGGFALLNDSKYGHRAKNGLISLNLLRATTFPDKTADRGIHRFAYAFCPFQRDDLAKVISEGYRLNNPLLVAEDVAFTSFAVVEDPGVIIETIKPAESGNGVVIRMYESLGRSTSTALLVDFEYSSAHLTDLLENPLGAADLDQLEFTPFEIKTILLERPS
ncbi:MAG: alpha-mannosidase [Actinomycetota bacterium]|nr:alpha-mannosidase [Actinomycetota bacterium]